MLAAEYSTLPEPMQRAIRAFFEVNEAWLGRLLESGRQAGDLTFDGDASDAANALTSTLEGAMLLARSYGDLTRFDTAAARVLREFAPTSRKARPTASPSRDGRGRG
jgi:TetR/AcrR family transcriptional repressor of nem operon